MGQTERSFLNVILNGDSEVQSTIAAAGKLTGNELRTIGRSVKITAAMCGDGSDVASVVFAAKFYGGKCWEQFKALVDGAAQTKDSLNNID